MHDIRMPVDRPRKSLSIESSVDRDFGEMEIVCPGRGAAIKRL